jgi:hypothetical protein
MIFPALSRIITTGVTAAFLMGVSACTQPDEVWSEGSPVPTTQMDGGGTSRAAHRQSNGIMPQDEYEHSPSYPPG